MIQLGTMELHRGVFWENELSEALVAQDDFFDIDGGYSSQFMYVGDNGRTIQLVASGSDSGSRGMFTQAQLDYVKSLEASQETVQFIYGSKTLNVKVEANPLAVTPLRKMFGHVSTDIYYGTITLKEVV